MSFHRCESLVLALVVSACVSSGNTSLGAGGQTAAGDTRGNSRLITRGELNEREGDSAYEVVESLNRRWLQDDRRGRTFGGGPIFARVVVDGTPRGGLYELHRIGASEIESMRFISAPDATIKYGTGYPGGAIEVTMRDRRGRTVVRHPGGVPDPMEMPREIKRRSHGALGWRRVEKHSRKPVDATEFERYRRSDYEVS